VIERDVCAAHAAIVGASVTAPNDLVDNYHRVGGKAAHPTGPSPRFAGSTVDKPLHIHRIGCAETRLLKTSRFFSNIHAGSIQSLSSQFART